MNSRSELLIFVIFLLVGWYIIDDVREGLLLLVTIFRFLFFFRIDLSVYHELSFGRLSFRLLRLESGINRKLPETTCCSFVTFATIAT